MRRQIYLGSEEFVAQHQPDRILAEIPRKQSQAKRSSLKDILARAGSRDQHIIIAQSKGGQVLQYDMLIGRLGHYGASAAH